MGREVEWDCFKRFGEIEVVVCSSIFKRRADCLSPANQNGKSRMNVNVQILLSVKLLLEDNIQNQVDSRPLFTTPSCAQHLKTNLQTLQ
jgi:hypothetical protein